MIAKNIMVLGGEGFLGKEITRLASRLDKVKVKSIHKNMSPTINSLPNVEYLKEEELDPKNLEKHILESNAIVHTIGTIIENNLSFQNKKSEDKDSTQQIDIELAKVINNIKEDS